MNFFEGETLKQKTDHVILLGIIVFLSIVILTIGFLSWIVFYKNCKLTCNKPICCDPEVPEEFKYTDRKTFQFIDIQVELT